MNVGLIIVVVVVMIINIILILNIIVVVVINFEKNITIKENQWIWFKW